MNPPTIDDFPLATEDDLRAQGGPSIDDFPLATPGDLEKNVLPGQALTAVMNMMDQTEQERPELAAARAGHSQLTKLAQGIPFLGHAFTAGKNWSASQAAKKITEGKAELKDYVNYAVFLRQQKELGDRGMPQKVFDTLMAIPGFGQEILTTGGAFNLAKGAASTALGGLGKSVGAQVAQAVLPTAAGVAASTALNPGLIAQKASERAMPEVQMQQTPQGELANVEIGDDKSFLEALPAGFLDAAIEMGTERAGGPIINALSKIPGVKRLAALKEGVIGKWLSKPGRTTEMLQETLKQAGWNGVIGEVLEERLGDAARLATGLESPERNVTGQLALGAMGDKEAMKTAIEQLAVEGLSFMVPGAMAVASQAIPQQAGAQAAGDPAITARLDAIQQQYVKDENFRKEIDAWLPKFQEQQDLEKSQSAYRVMEGDQRRQQQEADKAALDKYFRERMPEEPPPETIGGIRQLPVSPDVELDFQTRAVPPQEPQEAVEQSAIRPRRELPPLTVGQPPAPDIGIGDSWQEMPDDAPQLLNVPGVELYTAQDGKRYIRKAGDGDPLQKMMDARTVELHGMTVSQLNQEGSKYGLKGIPQKGRKIAQILAEEERRAITPREYADSPEGPMIEPVESGERQPVMLPLQNPISEIYDPKATPGRETELAGMTAAELKAQAAAMGLPKSPSKSTTIKRILEAEARGSELTDPVSQTQRAMEAAENSPPAKSSKKPATPPAETDTDLEMVEDTVIEPTAPKEPKTFDRPTAIKELADLENWLEDADVSDPDYDSRSIRAQLLEAKLQTKKPFTATLPGNGKPLTESPDVLRIAPSGPAFTAGGKILGAMKKWFTSKGSLPEEAFELSIKKDNSIARETKQLSFELAALRDAIGKTGSSFTLSAAGKEQINNALHGDSAALASLPSEVQNAVSAVRRHIDALSRRLIDNGLAQGDLQVSIEENLGSYVTRSYEVFDNPKWKGKVDATTRNKAHAFLKQENPDWSDHEIANLIDDMLTKEGATSLIAGRRLGSKDLSITKHRKDIAPEIRALLGEYKDPMVNAARAITKMANLAANHEFLKSVREAGMGKFFFEQGDAKRPTGFNSRFSAESSKVMEPLNGLMTTPEIKEAFDSAYSPNGLGDGLNDQLFRLYMKGMLLTKYAKTVLSPQATIRNFFGNPLFAIQNGHWRVGAMGAAAKAETQALRPELPDFMRGIIKDNKQWKDRVLRYAELGLIHGDIHAGELKSVLKDAMLDAPASVESNPLFQLAKKGAGVAAEVYQGVDAVWKIYAFENEVARYKAAYEAAGVKKTQAEIENEAADIVRNTYPTYSMIPAAVKAIRANPAVGAFVSFPAEVLRTTYHSFKQTHKELNDPVLRGIGAQRLAGNLLALSIPSAMTAMLRMLIGVTKEDDEDLREFVPPWSKNSDIAWLYKGTDGKPGWIDMSYTLPSSVWRKPLTAMMAGDNWEESFKEAAKELFGPFFSEELLFQRIVDILRNKTGTGREVYNEQASDVSRLSSMTGHVLEAMEPGVLTSSRRITKAAKGTIEPTGRAYNLNQELLAVGTGLRIQETDIAQSLGFAASAYADSMRSATKIFTGKFSGRGNVGEGQVASAYEETDAARHRLFGDISRKSQAAINLGIPESDVTAILSASGLSKDAAASVLAGNYTPYVPTPEVDKRAAASPEYESRVKELKPEVADQLKQQQIEQAVTLAKHVVQQRPKTLTDKEKQEGKTIQQKREEWQAQRDAARQKLLDSTLPREDVLAAFTEDVRGSIKNRALEAAKIRTFKRDMGW